MGFLYLDPPSFDVPVMWAPTAISSLVAWWNADAHGTANMTDDGAGLISAWLDDVNSLAVAAVTTQRPTWTEDAFNGAYAGLTFDGAANFMLMAALDALIPSGADPSTIAVVADPGAASGSAETVSSYGANGSTTRRQILRTGTGNGSVIQANDNSSLYSVLTPDAWITPAIVVAQFEAALLSVWRDGTSGGTDTGTLNTTATKLVIGANAATSPAGFFGGPIRHVMIFDAALSTVQRQQLEGWLAWDSGLTSALPSSHPFKSGRP